jgi:hypothetical protein
MELLLAQGADPNAKSNNVLAAAARIGDIQVLEFRKMKRTASPLSKS